MNDIARNAPCPCGSGRKYKQCCLRSGKRIRTTETGEPEPRSLWIPAILLAGLVAAVAVGMWKGFGLGVTTFGVFGIIAGLILIFRNPPPPNPNAGDPAGLNFGS
ncbi:MAG: hypothetical protein EA398_09260 [Deltaproteobacteria bacterium]|nr:MAG: hypothetical protein EA398_09260 [Deltaproteobacteria bacterium]